jgi:hypothetical protein
MKQRAWLFSPKALAAGAATAGATAPAAGVDLLEAKSSPAIEPRGRPRSPKASAAK